jgi:hypothetical protein
LQTEHIFYRKERRGFLPQRAQSVFTAKSAKFFSHRLCELCAFFAAFAVLKKNGLCELCAFSTVKQETTLLAFQTNTTKKRLPFLRQPLFTSVEVFGVLILLPF